MTDTANKVASLQGTTGHIQEDTTWRPISDPLIDIVVPCHNEAMTLKHSITLLRSYLSERAEWHFRITIASSGSTDGTVAVAQKLAHTYPNVFVHETAVKGRGLALKRAWADSPADILVYIDEDLSTDPSHLNDLVRPLIVGDAAIATGSRLRTDSNTTRGLKREIISRGYITLVKRLLHIPITDAQCGFKAIRADAAQEVLPSVKDDKWFFDTELLYRAHHNGWRIHEIGVSWEEDTDSSVALVQTAIEDIQGIDRLRREAKKFWTLERAAVISLLSFTAIFYLWNLTVNGYANSYYAAAVQAASTSWHAFFYGALDSVGWVSVDKPPVAIWVSALSARVFGFSSFSMLLPHALAGVATVGIVYTIVRRYFNLSTALIAGAAMALTPAAALMFRFNNPDSILTFLLAASAYTFMRSLEARHIAWLMATAAFVGTAFNTKMIQALIILPVYVMVYMIAAKPAFAVRLWHMFIAAISTIIAALWWPLLVSLTPASSRPYIGSTSDNSIWSLIFGYNGLSRFLGGAGQAGGGMGGGPNGGVGFGGQAGILRMFNSDFGPNIAWLLPLALIAGGTAIWWLQNTARTNLRRALILTMMGWVLIHGAVFSMTGGTIHPYYVVVMAPAIAVLVGAGLPYLYAAYKSGRSVQWLLPIAIFLSGATAAVLFGYGSTNLANLRVPIVVVTTLTSLALVWHIIQPDVRARNLALTTSAIAILLGPVAYSVTTVAVAHNGSIPTAGPNATAMAGSNNESATISTALKNYLVQHQGAATWIVAVSSANQSAPIQIATGQPVMAIGGFNGSDNTISLSEFKQLVREGKVKYFAVSSGGMGGFGGGMGGGGPGGNSSIQSWATSGGKVVDYGGSDNVTLYDLTSAV